MLDVKEDRRRELIVLLTLALVAILVGATIPWYISTGIEVLPPLIFLFLMTLPLVPIPLRALAGRPVDMFGPDAFLPAYLWIHVGLGTFLFMINPVRDLVLDPLIPVLNLSAIYAYFAGLILVKVLRTRTSSVMVIEQAAALYHSWNPARLRWVMVGGIMLSLTMAVIFFQRAGGIPILFENVEEGRVEAIWGNAYAAFIALSISYFYLAYWAYHISKPENKPFTLSLLFLLALTVIIQASFGWRSKLVLFFVTLLVVYNYLRSRIRLRFFIAAGVLLFIFIIVAGIWRISTADKSDPLSTSVSGLMDFGEGMLKRSTVGLVAVTDIFPERSDFQYGRVYEYPFRILLPGHQDEFPSWLKEASGLEFKGGGLPPSLVGEFYLNFGLPGVVFGFFSIGVFMAVIYLWVLRRPSLLLVVLYAVLLRHIGQSVSGGFSSTIGIQMVWALFLVMVIHWFVNRRIVRVRHEERSR